MFGPDRGGDGEVPPPEPDVRRAVTRRRFLATAAAGGLAGIAGCQRGRSTEPLTALQGTYGTTPNTGVSGDLDAGVTGRGSEPTADGSALAAQGERTVPVIGGNLNGRPRRLLDNLELLEASNTTWVRAFLDIRQKLAEGHRPERDPDVVALRQAARKQGCRLVVSLKWDFRANWGDKDPMRVPAAGSRDERTLCRAAARYLEAIGVPLDVVVLGNEPMWETPTADITGERPPIVPFTRAVKDHLVDHGDHGDPSYLLGSLNRLDRDALRTRQFPAFLEQVFGWAREDEDVNGVDLHVHYDDFSEARAMVATAREAVPDGTLLVTEFSPVWRYDRYKEVPIDAFDAGERFLRTYGRPAGMTPVEYFEDAKAHPRQPEELGDLYAALPWYNVDHVDDVYRLFTAYDVSVGTIGFMQGRWMREEDWTTAWTPYHINALFQPALLRTDRGLARTAHPSYLEAYRRRATPTVG